MTELSDDPANRVEVVGFQWSWQFRYRDEGFTVIGGARRAARAGAPGGRAGPARARQHRREPLVLGARLPVQARPHPRRRQRDRRDPDRGAAPTPAAAPSSAASTTGACTSTCGSCSPDEYEDWLAEQRAKAEERRRRHRAGHRARRGGRRRRPANGDTTGGGAVTVVVERPAVAGEPPEPEAHPRRHRAARLPHHHRPQAHRHRLHGDRLRLLPVRRGAGRGDPGRAVQPRASSSYRRAATTSCSRCTAAIMMFLFIGPFAFGLANYLVPLQIGARDMAFPRLNALSLLALPVRRPHDAGRVPHRRRRRRLRLDRLRARCRTSPAPRRRRRPVAHRRSCSPACRASSPRSTSWPPSSRCGRRACACSACRSSPGTCW